ncbi:MAG TPA: hypothetical protein VKB86_21085 [Pyrinomonadaceae bacterium]|nr:hypothetical protein [Pyrinomonadaceae bacterium]
MLKKIFFPLALVAAFALVLTACGGGSNNATTSNNSSAPANTSNKTSTTSTPTTTSSPTTKAETGDKVGVPECDDFLAKYEACVTGKVPEAARPQFKAALEQWRTSWRKTAETPEGKAGLTQACKAALDQTKVSMKSFNCEF